MLTTDCFTINLIRLNNILMLVCLLPDMSSTNNISFPFGEKKAVIFFMTVFSAKWKYTENWNKTKRQAHISRNWFFLDPGSVYKRRPWRIQYLYVIFEQFNNYFVNLAKPKNNEFYAVNPSIHHCMSKFASPNIWLQIKELKLSLLRWKVF